MNNHNYTKTQIDDQHQNKKTNSKSKALQALILTNIFSINLKID